MRCVSPWWQRKIRLVSVDYGCDEFWEPEVGDILYRFEGQGVESAERRTGNHLHNTALPETLVLSILRDLKRGRLL